MTHRSGSSAVVCAAASLAAVWWWGGASWAQGVDAPADAAPPGTINVVQNGIIEMEVQDADLFTVLQRLLRKTRTNIVFGPEVQGRVTVSLYEVTLEEALDAILRPNGYGYIRDGHFFHVKTIEQLAEMERARRPLITRVHELSYISPGDARDLLSPMLSEFGTITVSAAAESGLDGGTGGQGLAIEDMLIITDLEERFAALEQQLQRIDRRPRQVLLEATLVAADLNENNSLGIDFNVLGGVNFERVRFALGTVSIGANSAAGASAGAGAAGPGAAAAGQQSFGELTPQVPFGKLDDTTYRMATDFAGKVPSGGLSVGFVTDEVTAFLRALEEVTNTTVLSNPKVLVVNKQLGRLLVGSRNGYRTLTTSQTSTTQNVEFLETGTELRFRPFISADGYVRLEVTPRDSSGSVDALGLPNETTTEVTTNIIVKDGHTIVIGGLFREATSSGRSQVPLLGSIPAVGSAFGATSDSTIKQEIIILLTVRILDDETVHAQLSGELLDDVQRQRVGVRRHMQWTGRSRLAQAHYESALRQLAEGNTDRALWYVDLALANRPQLIEAIKLREEIRQQRDWEANGSLLRDFIAQSMLQEQGQPQRRDGQAGAEEPPAEAREGDAGAVPGGGP